YWGDGNPVTDQITSFSSRGPVTWTDSSGTPQTLIKPDIIAPGAVICAARHDSIYPDGEDPIYKPCLNDKYVQIPGTSTATPQVTGAVALLKQKHPGWTPDEIKNVLKNTAKKLIDPTTNKEYDINTQGSGRLDVIKAISISNTGVKPQSKLVNSATAILTGQLQIKLQKKINGVFTDVSTVVNQQINIPASGLLKLDIGKDNLNNQVFTGFNNLNVKADSFGYYRVYVRFEKNGQFVEGNWEFTVAQI
ncbi:MAG: S8 family serine peptidase, partial [Nanoarchaeota archaeon]